MFQTVGPATESARWHNITIAESFPLTKHADSGLLQRCQVSRFRRETPVFRRPLRLPYGRTYLPFSSFTYGTSGSDRYTHAGEATVLLLDRQAHHCLLYLRSSRTNARCARRCTIVNMANWSDKSEKIKKYMQKYKDDYSKQYSCIVKSSKSGLGHKYACIFPTL